jgi:hypothetical protein
VAEALLLHQALPVVDQLNGLDDRLRRVSKHQTTIVHDGHEASDVGTRGGVGGNQLGLTEAPLRMTVVLPVAVLG